MYKKYIFNRINPRDIWLFVHVADLSTHFFFFYFFFIVDSKSMGPRRWEKVRVVKRLWNPFGIRQISLYSLQKKMFNTCLDWVNPSIKRAIQWRITLNWNLNFYGASKFGRKHNKLNKCEHFFLFHKAHLKLIKVLLRNPTFVYVYTNSLKMYNANIPGKWY